MRPTIMPPDIFEVAKTHTPKRSESAAHTEKITKKT
jgi:hypothetical protein